MLTPQCIEAYIEDPLTGLRKNNPKETRCQRCVERKVTDCTITNVEVSYARPATPKHPLRLSSSTAPTLPEPASQGVDQSTVVKDPVVEDTKLKAGVSPGSDNLSQASGASTFWKTLFEEDASIRVKRVREDSPQGEAKQQGSTSFTFGPMAELTTGIYFGNSHMGPSFVQDFVNVSLQLQSRADNRHQGNRVM